MSLFSFHQSCSMKTLMKQKANHPNLQNNLPGALVPEPIHRLYKRFIFFDIEKSQGSKK